MDDDGALWRRQARAVLAASAALLLIAGMVWLAHPGFIDPMLANPAAVGGVPIQLLLGAAGAIVGEVWIHRILSGVGKQDDPTWRYHR